MADMYMQIQDQDIKALSSMKSAKAQWYALKQAPCTRKVTSLPLTCDADMCVELSPLLVVADTAPAAAAGRILPSPVCCKRSHVYREHCSRTCGNKTIKLWRVLTYIIACIRSL